MTLKYLFFVEKSQLNPLQRYPDKIHLFPNYLSSIYHQLSTDTGLLPHAGPHNFMRPVVGQVQ